MVLRCYCDAGWMLQQKVIFHVNTKKYVFLKDRKIRLLAVVGQTDDRLEARQKFQSASNPREKFLTKVGICACNRFLAKKTAIIEGQLTPIIQTIQNEYFDIIATSAFLAVCGY